MNYPAQRQRLPIELPGWVRGALTKRFKMSQSNKEKLKQEISSLLKEFSKEELKLEIDQQVSPVTGRCDMRCKVCEHSPESHYAGTGWCYSCSVEDRCVRYVGNSPQWTAPPPTPRLHLVERNKT